MTTKILTTNWLTGEMRMMTKENEDFMTLPSIVSDNLKEYADGLVYSYYELNERISEDIDLSAKYNLAYSILEDDKVYDDYNPFIDKLVSLTLEKMVKEPTDVLVKKIKANIERVAVYFIMYFLSKGW